MLGEQQSYRRGLIGRKIVIERFNRHATFAIARALADLDGCLGIAGNQELVFGLCGFLANAFELFEDGIGFGGFFLPEFSAPVPYRR